MKDDPSGSDPFVLLPRATSNSRIVREIDPRASRDLWLLLMLVAGLVAGMVLYAWPRVQAHHLDAQTQDNQRRHERLVEQNRKLRLERASLESLARVESIALTRLGLATPEPSRTFVVERPAPRPDATRLARAPEEPAAPRIN